MIFFEDKDIVVYFGKKDSQIQHLQQTFPQFNFKRIKQVHGDKIVHTSPHSVDFSKEADAHYTGEKKLALAISTADCIPVMIYSPEPRWIASIHAGWRGVLNQITPKTVNAFIKLGCKPDKLHIFIGPHIGFQSFEVEDSIRDQLLRTINKPEASFSKTSREGRSLVSLFSILKNQLQEVGVHESQIHFLDADTFTNLDYHSYRRDKESSGRQLSFIVLK